MKSSAECTTLMSFLSLLGDPQTALMDRLLKAATDAFPRDKVELHEGSLVIEFARATACFAEICKAWGQPVEVRLVAPPALGPEQDPLPIHCSEDNPYLWITKRFVKPGWSLTVKEHDNHITSLLLQNTSAGASTPGPSSHSTSPRTGET